MADKATEHNSQGSIFIGADVQFKGDMTVPGCASVDGKFEGTLKAKNLIVGQSGNVSGQISVETAEIRGAVSDQLTVETSLVVRSTGVISGAVSYSKMMVEEGGELNGKIDKIANAGAAAGAAYGMEPKVVSIQRSSE